MSCHKGMLDPRGAFKSKTSANNVIKRAFNTAGSSYAKRTQKSLKIDYDSMAVVSDSYLASQRRGITDLITAAAAADGDEETFLGIKRSWDETACRFYAQDAPQLQKLIEQLDVDKDLLKVFDSKRLGVVFQIMQQRCAVARDDNWEPIYLAAKILENTTASNMVACLEESLPELATSRVQELAKDVYHWCFLQLMGDHIAANRLAQAILAHRLPDVLIQDARCAMHQAHHVFLGMTRPWNITAPMYSIGTGIRSGANQTKMAGALLKHSKKVKIHYGRPPPAEGALFRDWLFDISIGRFQNLEMIDSPKERERIRIKVGKLRTKIKVLNGRLWLKELEHFCWIENEAEGVIGQPCCANAAETQKKIGEVFLEVFSFIIDAQNVASQHDWFKTVHAGKSFAFGTGCHQFLPKAFCTVCPLTEADTEAALAESPDDSRTTMFAKRLKRGVKAITSPLTMQRLLTMMATTMDPIRY